MTPFSIAGVQTTVSATHGNVAAMASKIDPDGGIVALTDPGEGASIHRINTTAGSSGGVD